MREAKCVYEKEVFDEIFTVARESPFVGNHYYGFVDWAYPENERLLANAIDDLLEIRDNDWQLNKMILVHCATGFSRSVAIVAGYMVIKGYVHTAEDVLGYIKKIRPLANPVPELVKLLERYEMNEWELKRIIVLFAVSVTL